jgi:hypothetical protein
VRATPAPLDRNRPNVIVEWTEQDQYVHPSSTRAERFGEGSTVADTTDILLKHWEDQRTKFRHSEDQRATLTNIVLVVSSIGFGFLAKQGLRDSMLAATIPLTIIGLYGVIASAKLAERASLHNRQGRAFADRLDELLPDLQLRQTYALARRRHNVAYGRLARLRLRHLWIALHGGIAAAGLVLTLMIVIS